MFPQVKIHCVHHKAFLNIVNNKVKRLRITSDKKNACPSTKGGSSSQVVLGLAGIVENSLEMVGVECHCPESVYLGLNHEVVVILAQGFEDLESHEAVLPHCGLYDMCECGMYVLLDFESAGNSLAHAKDMQISGGSWAASEVGAKKGESTSCVTW